MATVAATLSKAARECSVTLPTNLVGSTALTAIEFRDHLANTVDEILDRLDLPDPVTKDVVLTGTGIETLSLPADFKRLTRDPLAIYETTTTRRACIGVPSNGAWTHLKQTGSAAGDRFYRLSGNEDDGFSISLYKPLEASHSVTVSYVSKNWLSQATVPGSDWTDNEAVLLLPARIVELGVIWRFRQRKGMPYADRQADYELRMARIINDGRTVRSIDMGGGSNDGHPMRVPVPDFIPSA